MINYKKINIAGGWLVFLVGAVTYLLTIEPTTSFWDCGEFIASAYKLEVGHPPGAPLFMIIARIFSLFTFGNEKMVAAMVNAWSGLASAFTVMFLFWTITHLAKKIISKGKKLSAGQTIAVLGSGLIGALAYTFTDTFWFSAVEGEVYATSSLFTALVFWAILKWENVANERHSLRWLILIAYLMGLSIGVHLLNLLAIPSIVFVYYFKKYKTTKSGVIYASLIAMVILGTIIYGVIPGIVKIASKFELIFINGFGLPYKTGVIIYALMLIGLIVLGLYYTTKKHYVVLNTIILSFLFIVIGYSSFTMIVIRSHANPPMDENNPEHVFSLLSYLNREQYGDRPLLYGQYYNAPVIDQENRESYIQKNGKYKKITLTNPEYKYDPDFMTFFPRMYSFQDRHISQYKSWANIKGTPIRVPGRSGESELRYKPTFFENLKFFFRYQVWHMYFRYFLWNFAGRQNDIQGHGEPIKGNWLSGIPFWDNYRLGNQDDLPLKFSGKSTNKYYLLPLILGIIGLIYNYRNERKTFWIVLMLFFFTGIAIVIYLNQTPLQPRERDYAYAGSFYAFAIWIGMGVPGIFNYVKKYIQAKVAAILAIVISLSIPAILVAENRDDHDRSGRYTARDWAINYLNSCVPNAILFTYGDNDTFPLWYVQEVEGIRTDVRVVNLSLLSTDWYIDQMKRKAYESDPVPFSLEEEQFRQGIRDIVPIRERIKKYVDIERVMRFVASDSPDTRLGTMMGEQLDYLPTRKLLIPVDSSKVITNGTVPKGYEDKILPALEMNLSKSYLMKSDLMILDLLATNKWERPVYFATSIGTENYLGLQKYFQFEGFAYRLVPYETPVKDGEYGNIISDIMYDNVMNKFTWGRMGEPDVYIDEQNKRTSKIMDIRGMFARLSTKLVNENKLDSAKLVLDKSIELMPNEKFPYDYTVLPMIENYYKAGFFEKGDSVANVLADVTIDEVEYFMSLRPEKAKANEYERNISMHSVQRLANITGIYNRTELNQRLTKKLDDIMKNMSLGK